MTKRVNRRPKPAAGKASAPAVSPKVTPAVSELVVGAAEKAKAPNPVESWSPLQLVTTLGLPPSYLYLSGYLYVQGYASAIGLDADLFPRSADAYIAKAFDPFILIVTRALPDINIYVIAVLALAALLGLFAFAVSWMSKLIRRLPRLEQFSVGMLQTLAKPERKAALIISLSGLLLAAIPYVLLLILAFLVLPTHTIGARAATEEIDRFIGSGGCTATPRNGRHSSPCVTLNTDNGNKQLASGLLLMSSEKAVAIFDPSAAGKASVRLFVLEKGMTLSRDYAFSPTLKP